MVKSAEPRHYAKFYQNRSNRGRDSAIIGFFKIAAAVILDFNFFEFLIVGTVKKVELRHHAKFRRNRSNRGRGIAIFQDGGGRHLQFLKFQIFNGRNGQKGRTAPVCKISSKSLEPRPRYVSF